MEVAYKRVLLKLSGGALSKDERKSVWKGKNELKVVNEDLDEDDQDVIIIGRIIELNEVREFDRDNGVNDLVLNKLSFVPFFHKKESLNSLKGKLFYYLKSFCMVKKRYLGLILSKQNLKVYS